VRITAFGEASQIVRAAEILEQQQAARDIHLVDAGHVGADRFEHPAHAHVRAYVLPVRRCIHDDVGASRPEDPEVPAKAGIARCRLDALDIEPQIV